MKYFGEALGEKHSALGKLIRRKDCIDDAKRLFFEIHCAVNMPLVYGVKQTEAGELLSGISDGEYAIMPSKNDETIAWSLWHIARIEDVTMNMLAARTEQVFSDEWRTKINAPVSDTGNSMSDDEIMKFSKAVDIRQLIAYRNAVAVRTREIVGALCAEDMRRKVSAEDIERVALCGAVSADEESAWLLDYWAGKDIAGLLLMPPTRHAMLHLNSCGKIKQLLTTRKSFYRF